MFHPSTGIFAGASRHVESRVGRMRCRLWPGLFTPPIRKSPEISVFLPQGTAAAEIAGHCSQSRSQAAERGLRGENPAKHICFLSV